MHFGKFALIAAGPASPRVTWDAYIEWMGQERSNGAGTLSGVCPPSYERPQSQRGQGQEGFHSLEAPHSFLKNLEDPGECGKRSENDV